MPKTIRLCLLGWSIILGLTSVQGEQAIMVENKTWQFLKLARAADPSVVLVVPPQNLDNYHLNFTGGGNEEVEIIYPDGFAIRESKFVGCKGVFGVDIKVTVNESYDVRVEYPKDAKNNTTSPTNTPATTGNTGPNGANVTTGNGVAGGGGYYGGGGYGPGYGMGGQYPANANTQTATPLSQNNAGNYVNPNQIKKTLSKGASVKFRQPRAAAATNDITAAIIPPEPPPVIKSTPTRNSYRPLPKQEPPARVLNTNNQLVTTILWCLIGVIGIAYILYHRVQKRRSGA